MTERDVELFRARCDCELARAEVRALQSLFAFRNRDDSVEAQREFRRAAFALVEEELRSFRPTLDVRVRSDHVAVSSIEECSEPTLQAAIDELRKRSA